MVETVPTPASRVLAMDGVEKLHAVQMGFQMAITAVKSLSLKSSYHTCHCLSVPWRGDPDPVHTHKARPIRLLWAHMFQSNKLDDFGLHIYTIIFKKKML